MPSINRHSLESFKNRFLLDIPDEKLNQELIKKINDNYNTWGGYFVDWYHSSKFLHLIFERKWKIEK